MKKFIYLFLLSLSLFGCSESKKELYKQTDKFVLSLNKDYKSYGLLGGADYAVTTSDGLYKITPIGRRHSTIYYPNLNTNLRVQ